MKKLLERKKSEAKNTGKEYVKERECREKQMKKRQRRL
jgi:hypothetical protein